MAEPVSASNRKGIHILFWGVASSLVIASILGSVAIISVWARLPDKVDANSNAIKENKAGISDLSRSLSSLIKENADQGRETAVALAGITTEIRQSNKLGDERNSFMKALVVTQTKIALTQATRTSKIESAIKHIDDKDLHKRP